MNIRTPIHRHPNSATDRTQASSAPYSRMVAAALACLTVFAACIPAAVAVSAEGPVGPPMPEAPSVERILLSDRYASLSDEHDAVIPVDRADEGMGGVITESVALSLQRPTRPPASTPSNTPTPPIENLPDDGTLTQEMIALSMESSLNRQAKGGTRIYYPWPSGSMAVELYKDGRRILAGQVADIGGTVYVPVQRFADLFGSFKTVYTQSTEQVVITGKNLSITVRAGDPYITVNERIFYSGKSVLSLGGWIFVPLTSMCKALNATVNIRKGYYDAYITSGDPSKVAWADDYYNQTDLYWLARIISAEAKGEPFAGQIAVGNVVLNRKRSSQFPNTVKGVIFDTKYGTQFSPVASGTIYQTPTASAIRAAKICLEGYSLSTKMLYFYNPAIATSSWIGRTRPYIMTIGNHKFYG